MTADMSSTVTPASGPPAAAPDRVGSVGMRELPGVGCPEDEPASLASWSSTSSVCWPSNGAGPLMEAGDASIWARTPSWRMGPTAGSSTFWTIPLCRIWGWPSASTDVMNGSAATSPSLLTKRSIHSSSVFSCIRRRIIRRSSSRSSSPNRGALANRGSSKMCPRPMARISATKSR